MRILTTFNSSIKALGVNKIRTFLTMLGVIIGVFAVVSLVSLVKGVENFIVDRFNSLGSNLIFITQGGSSMAFSNNKFEEKHLDSIEKELGNDIVSVAPSIRSGKTIKYKNKSFYATITGTNEQVMDLVNVEVVVGDYFTKEDVTSKEKVAIIGPEIAEEFFGKKTAGVGQKIKLSDTTLTIIGIAKERGGTQDSIVVMPYTTLQDAVNINNFANIVTKATDQNNIDMVMDKVELALLRDLDKDDFSVVSQADVLKSFQSVLNVLSIGLTAIAGISLVVGGIGIMNIMLVSVNERINEIGLRKALGATSLDVGAQFLIEAVFISVIGGLIGLTFGFVVTIISKPWLNAEIPWWAIILAMGFSLAVGVAFGTYPALKAAKKDPIEALRFE